MAEAGVKIDFSKKYRMEDGTKITDFERNQIGTYPIRAYTEHGEDFGYTEDGFFHLNKIKSKCNLVLDEDQPQETKKRKVVQITTCMAITSDDCDFLLVYALCDDGTIFERINAQDWEKLPDLPQD